MNEIVKVLENIDTLLVAIVIGVIVAGIMEVVKYFVTDGLSDEQIRIGTLILGLAGGVIAMYLNNGDFTTYAIVGLAGGLYAPSIYEIILKRFGLSKREDELNG